MLSVTDDVSKDVYESELSRSGGNESPEKFSLLVSQIGELYSKPEAIEDVGNDPVQLHRLPVGR